MTDPNATATINRLLLRTAINADPICDRSEAQKLIRVARLRAELAELGYRVERITKEKVD